MCVSIKQEEVARESEPMQTCRLCFIICLFCIYHSCFAYIRTLALTCSSDANKSLLLNSWTMFERRKRETLSEQRRLYDRLVLVGFTLWVPHWPPRYDSTARPTFNTSDKGGDARMSWIISCLWTRMKFYAGAGRRRAQRVTEIYQKSHFLQGVGGDNSTYSQHLSCQRSRITFCCRCCYIYARCTAWDSGCGLGWLSTADLTARLEWQCESRCLKPQKPCLCLCELQAGSAFWT